MVCGNDVNDVDFCLGRVRRTGTAILDVIQRVFNTRNFDGNMWIADISTSVVAEEAGDQAWASVGVVRASF
jgi:hypothetical protein